MRLFVGTKREKKNITDKRNSKIKQCGYDKHKSADKKSTIVTNDLPVL